MSARQRILIIGLDSASPELIFDAWCNELPAIASLMRHGVSARLESCIPAITVPAWACMMSSRDPGQLGIYGFRNRADRGYTRMITANARAITVPRLWDLLGKAGKRVGLIGVPQTYPISSVNGDLVSCFLTPSDKAQFTYPLSLKQDIARWVRGEFLIDVPYFRSENKSAVLQDIYRMAEQHFTVCKRLLERKRYDFFMTVDMGVDRIHHAFWKYMDPCHPKHVPESPFSHAIHDYYRFIDEQIAELLNLVDDRTIVLVVSDHGAKAMLGGFCLNEWLIKEGYLALEEYPETPTSLDQCRIDWTRTYAWGAGGYYGRLFLNVAGREPKGIVASDRVDELRNEIAAKLESLPDHTGQIMGTCVFRPEDIYREVQGVAPDLIVYFGDLNWRSVGSVGVKSLYTFENDTGPDDANHSQYGIFILYDPRRGGGRRIADISIYDVAPTLLHLLGMDVPPEMIGKVRDLWD